MVRQHLGILGFKLREDGDAIKASREIYKIANDDSSPLHFPLGLNSVSMVTAQVENVLADLDNQYLFFHPGMWR